MTAGPVSSGNGRNAWLLTGNRVVRLQCNNNPCAPSWCASLNIVFLEYDHPARSTPGTGKRHQVCRSGLHLQGCGVDWIGYSGIARGQLRHAWIQRRKRLLCAPETGSPASIQTGTQLAPEVFLPHSKVQWSCAVDSVIHCLDQRTHPGRFRHWLHLDDFLGNGGYWCMF